MKLIDLTGQRFGRLVVLERAENKNGRVRWKCKCDCGNEITTSSGCLRSGDSQSCGCLNSDILKSRCINLVGKKFNRWTVLERAENHGYIAHWKCQCDCGNIGYVSSGNLTSGQSKSCGCLNNELIIERNIKRFEQDSLVGQKFGKLTVIRRTDERDNGMVVYECQCDCGNITKARSSRLVDGSKQSCGCLNSKGEEKIAKILSDNNISYESQKTFDDCRNPKTNACFRFDFFINNSYLIEYDGLQHFKDCRFGHSDLYERQEHDRLKDEYCKEHNIPLIRIPYTKYDTLCLDDLLLRKEVI